MKAVVMAGGEGTRLRPMTANMPKPLLPVVNKPIMEHVLRLLKRHGFTETVVTVQFLASLVRNYFGDGEELGMALHYATEETPLGTAGSVKNAEDALRDDTLPGHLRRRAHRLRPDRPGASSTTTRARWSPSASPGCPTRSSSASPSSTTTAGCSASWRSPPGARCSPTPSTPASTSWSPRSSTTSPAGESVDWSGDVFPQLLERRRAALRLRRRGLLGGRRHPRELPQGPGRRAVRAGSTSSSTRFEVSPGVWVAEGAEVDPEAVLKGPLYIGDYAKVEAGRRAARVHRARQQRRRQGRARSCTAPSCTTTSSSARRPTCGAASSARTPT